MTTATAVLIFAAFVVLDLVKYWISEVRERGSDKGRHPTPALYAREGKNYYL